VLGRSFELGLLSRVSKVPAAVLLESFDHALATEFIVAAPERLARFAFGHELIRTVLYDGLPKLERAALHLRVAHVLEELEQGGREVAPAELAHHCLLALPHGDPVRAAEQGERAAGAAMSAAAYADAAAILRRAQAALDLAVEPAPHLRCRLHFRMSVCLRVSNARESIAELRKAVALARATSLYPLLAEAGQAMVRAPGVVMMEDGRAVLEDALAGLGEEAHALRSTVLSHLAWCAPYCFDRDKTEELASRALEHARLARSRPALITALRTQIHFSGGPCRPHDEIKGLLNEADQLAAAEGHAMRITWSNQASTLRAAFALQRGDRRGVERALDTLSSSARELQHAELIWHSDRIRIVDRMNRGELRDTAQQLRELRTRGKGLLLFAHEQVCSHDFMVLRRQTVGLDEVSFALSSLAQPAPQDSPSVLGLKLRAAVDVGRPDIVRMAFGEFVQRGLARLPCDRDHLGVLGHLALAALMLEDREHVELLFRLLEPHAAMFAADLSFHSDGSVAHVVGQLARYLGRRDAALAYFHDAVLSNDRFGLRARAAESRLELASTLLGGTPHEQAVARELLAAVQSAAYTIGMAPLLGRATALLSLSGSSLETVYAAR
jgi:tetratricopeptide (TPR) repeat protein